MWNGKVLIDMFKIYRIQKEEIFMPDLRSLASYVFVFLVYNYRNWPRETYRLN